MAPWDKKYEELKAFKQKHGHCRATPKANKSLATWLCTQRRMRRKLKKSELVSSRISKLEALGVEWDPKASRANEEWCKKYEELKRFKEQHGHCDVVLVHPQYTPLGNWVTEQLRCYFNENYKKHLWNEKKFDLLDSIGFDWNMVARRHEAKQKQDDEEDCKNSLELRSDSISREDTEKEDKQVTKKRKNTASAESISRPKSRRIKREDDDPTHIEDTDDQRNFQNIAIKDESSSGDGSDKITGSFNDRIENLSIKFGIELKTFQSMKDKLSHLEKCIENRESTGSIALRIYNLEKELVLP